jgi:LysR family transcriptional regulator, hydrogen peroxide-inducible genes activator
MRNQLSFQSLEQFVALARAKSFTRAADELHLSQSALSRAIQKLEDSWANPSWSGNPATSSSPT